MNEQCDFLVTNADYAFAPEGTLASVVDGDSTLQKRGGSWVVVGSGDVLDPVGTRTRIVQWGIR